MNKVLPKRVCLLLILKSPLPLPPSPTFMQQPPPSYVLQTVNPIVCINSFSCPTDNFVTGNLNLLRPHVELSPNTDPFFIPNHDFDTYRNLQNLLQLHSTDIQSSTLSTIHVNDFLEKLVLLETFSQIKNS